MKKHLYYFSLCFFLMLMQNIVLAQGHQILDRLDVTQVLGEVRIIVTIKAGYSCFGMNIMRSEDSLQFTRIGQISGICGGSSEATTYTYTDENPIKNKISYYRLELGGQGNTETFSIRVVDTEASAFLVIPNPANERTSIYFRNMLSERHNLLVFTQFGAVVMRKETQEQFFDLNLEDINSGNYFFVILTEKQERRAFGRLVIQH